MSIRYLCSENMQKGRYIVLLILVLTALNLSAQSRRERVIWHSEWVVENGDSVAVYHITPVRKYARKPDMRRYARLVRAVKRVYPLAQEAKSLMATMEMEFPWQAWSCKHHSFDCKYGSIRAVRKLD